MAMDRLTKNTKIGPVPFPPASEHSPFGAAFGRLLSFCLPRRKLTYEESPWGAAVRTVKKLHSCLIARVGATIGRPRTPAAMASPPGGYGIRPYGVGVGVPDDPGSLRRRWLCGRIWNPPLRRRGRACPARNLPRKRAPTYSRGRGMPRPYQPVKIKTPPFSAGL